MMKTDNSYIIQKRYEYFWHVKAPKEIGKNLEKNLHL